MRTMVHSHQLQFTRDGRTLIVAEPDAVTLVKLPGGARQRMPLAGVQAVAACADQVWVATRAGAMFRLTGDGRPLDEHALSADPDAALIPAAIGAPAALWTARVPVMLADELGALSILPTQVDAAIPVTGRRFAHYAGLRVTLPAGSSATLASGVRIAGGGIVFDGASLVLIAEHARGRDLVVLALASGRVLQTMAVPPGAVRIAARRGLAVVHDAPRRLAILDLRFGRHLGAVVTDDDVTDVAIEPDGNLLAIRFDGGDLELVPTGEPLGAVNRRSALRGGPRDVEASPREPAEPGASGPAATGGPDVDVLESRPNRGRLLPGQALVELDRELCSVALGALCAIASAWETQRLGEGNASQYPYVHEIAAMFGKTDADAAAYLAAAQGALAEHEAVLAADPTYRRAPAPVAELADEFGLSGAAIDVLLVIAGPALHGDLARLYGILGNTNGRALVDERLVQHVLGDRVSRHDVAAELDPSAPLVRLGIVEVKPSRSAPFAALEVDPVVLSRLRGEPSEVGLDVWPRPRVHRPSAARCGGSRGALSAFARSARVRRSGA